MSNAQSSDQTLTAATDLRDRVAFAAAEIINREFVSLLSLAEVLNDDAMTDIICQLGEAAHEMFPNANRLFAGTDALAERIGTVSFDAIARHANEPGAIDDLDAAIRYHGARIADVARRLARVI